MDDAEAPSAATLATADSVREANAALDEALLAAAAGLHPHRLHDLEAVPPGQEAWSAATVLGHLGEFPRYFAADLRRWKADAESPVGRTLEHGERLEAVRASRGLDLPALIQRMETAFAELAGALELLRDEDLVAASSNRKYGEEPLTEFLDRYVLGHKYGHLAQLATMPAARSGSHVSSS
jgi:hypothetical protein